MSVRLVLTPEQRRTITRGSFVRVEVASEGVLVGRVDGTWRAYANVCRHQASPLDLGSDTPMSDDKRFLLCGRHGALYRPSDGLCVSGPCVGESLASRIITERPDGLWVEPGPDDSQPRYPHVAVDVDAEEVEDAGARLFELGATGVEERDATTLAHGATGKTTLVASFDREEDANDAIEELPGRWAPRMQTVVGDAWRDEWKKHFEPFSLGGGIVVCPPWRSYDAGPDERTLVLEPGRAFGTGLHETTALAAAALVKRAERFRGRPILDVGCGSGILSLVALTLGAAHARAVDIDLEAVHVTRENAVRNGMNEKVYADDTTLDRLDEKYTAIVANIDARTLVELAPLLERRLAPGGFLVLAGFLGPHGTPPQADDVRTAYQALQLEEQQSRGEWAVMVLSA